MKPPRFEYHRPETLKEAVELLAAHAALDAKLIAGGQSLVPLMNLRLARPGVLVDLQRVADLRGLSASNGGWQFGALLRHSDVEDSAELRTALPLLPAVVHHIGYRAIRNRGTVGGSICHADPAAEWPLLVRLLDAELIVRGPQGDRVIPSEAFFKGFMDTAVEPDEVLCSVRIPAPSRPWSWGFTEFTRTAGDFAVSAVGVVLERAADDTVVAARVAVAGQAEVPMRLANAEAALVGGHISDTAAHQRAAEAAGAEVDPPSDGNGSGDYKRQLLSVQLRRVLGETVTVEVAA
jgi:carbon-monoxide dehydrogenase medium subunit